MVYLPASKLQLEENVTHISIFSKASTNREFNIAYHLFRNGIRIYTDVKLIQLSSSDIEETVKYMKYGGCGRQSTNELRERFKSVRNVAFPSMTLVFYGLLYDQLRMPTFEEFRDTFLSQKNYFEIQGNTIFCKYHNQNVYFDYYSAETRLWIAYPAFIRDLHYACLLHESEKCDKLLVSTFADEQDKVDVMYYLINNRGRFCVDLKNNMRTEYVSKNPFNRGRLIIDMGNPQLKDFIRSQFGDYYLFNKNAVDFAMKYNVAIDEVQRV